MDRPPEPVWAYLGTSDGLRRVRLDGEHAAVEAASVNGHAVRDIEIHPHDPRNLLIACGLRGWGLHRSSDGGSTADALGFEDRWVWGVTRHPTDPETVFAGTEPPMVYRSRDGADTFTALDGVDDVERRDRWTFFHEPFHAGHVHAITLHPDRPERILAGVEHGGVLRSTDGGATWTDTRPGTDAHRLGIDPTDPDRVLLGAGSGLFESTDGGQRWAAVEALRGRYVHTVAFAPTAPDRVVVYTDRDGDAVHVSGDGGRTWSSVGSLPAARPADPVRFHPSDPDTLVYAGDIEGGSSQLHVSTDLGRHWEPVGEPLEKVWRLELVPIP